MIKTKPVFHEFDPVIYPFKLWVAFTDDIEPITSHFKRLPEDTWLDSVEWDNRGAITISSVYRAKSGDIGVLIIFSKAHGMAVSTIAHESSHAADFFWYQMGEERTNGEANAYLVGWIAGCCEEVRKFKRKKKKK